MTTPSGYPASFSHFLQSSPCSSSTPRFRSPKPSSGLPTNLLFFGCVTTLGQDEFVNTLKGELQNNEQARTLIMQDIYQIGKVLDKKHVNLRLSYRHWALE